MATATKTKVKNFPPNSNKRSTDTRKKEQCQWCKTKSPLADQFTVVNDLEANDGAGKVVKQKVGKRKLPEKQSHWCGECAEKRVKMSQRWLDRRAGKAPAPAKAKKAKAPAKAKPAKKAAKPAAKAAAKPKPKAAKKAPRKAPAKPKADTKQKVQDEAPF
jgi:hypothetical protein